MFHHFLWHPTPRRNPEFQSQSSSFLKSEPRPMMLPRASVSDRVRHHKTPQCVAGMTSCEDTWIFPTHLPVMPLQTQLWCPSMLVAMTGASGSSPQTAGTPWLSFGVGRELELASEELCMPASRSRCWQDTVTGLRRRKRACWSVWFWTCLLLCTFTGQDIRTQLRTGRRSLSAQLSRNWLCSAWMLRVGVMWR